MAHSHENGGHSHGGGGAGGGNRRALAVAFAINTAFMVVEALGMALSAVTPEDVRGFFGHCGYPLAAQPL